MDSFLHQASFITGSWCYARHGSVRLVIFFAINQIAQSGLSPLKVIYCLSRQFTFNTNTYVHSASRMFTFFHSHNFLKMLHRLCVSPHIMPVFGTSEQKLCDIYSSIRNAISSFRSPLGPPFDFLFNFCSCQTARCLTNQKGFL